ncbi:MAG: putative serine/threonine protein phosphatase [Ilumatobacteraceae bacterium]|nr:putative serine/threonine protein phosphatase [Ilumatobacteraceae bacterium]
MVRHTDTSRPASRDRWSLPRAFGRWVTLTVVAMVIIVGGGATILLYRLADINADNQRADLAMRATRALAATTSQLEAGLSGASSLVDADGTVDQARFNAFADRVVAATDLRTIGFEPLIADAGRAAFEQKIGTSIKELDAGGALVAAARRADYAPVEWSYPASETAAAVRGFDIVSDPPRAAAAAQALEDGTAAFSSPVALQPSGTTAFIVVQPLYRPGAPTSNAAERRAAVVGYVSSAVGGERLLEAMLTEMPGDTRLRVADGDALLASTPIAPDGGHRIEVTDGGRPWAITLERPRPHHLSALFTAFGTVLAAGLVGLFLGRNRRQTQELRASAQSVQLLGVLSEHLATADSVDEMADAVSAHGPAAVGAQDAVITLVRSAHEDGLVRAGSSGHPIVDEPRPLIDAWRQNTNILVGDSGDLRRRYPATAAAFAGRGIEAVAALPLRRPSGEIIGVLSWEWNRRQRFGARTLATLDAVVELCQQAVLRAQAQETRRATAVAQSTHGQRLSVARSSTEVATEVVVSAPAASGAPIVAIGLFNPGFASLRLMRSSAAGILDPTGGPDTGAGVFSELPVDPSGELVRLLRRGQRVQFRDSAEIDEYPALRQLVGPKVDKLSMFPLLDSGGTLVGVLVFVYGNTPRFGVWNEPGRMMTIADLTAQTLERTDLYQRQHELVLELQRRTLPELPSIPGISVAARYLPSSSALGLGGDWYEVQPIGDGLVGLVVGDVVGHGIQAIADRTEIRTTVSTLLRTDTDLAHVASQSSGLLASESTDVVFATAVLMVVDCARGQLRYVRAGHPPPMVLSATGEVTVLEAAGTTPIGIDGAEAVPGVAAIASGSVIVAYTDGLVERRGETIDDGLDRLHDALARCAAPIGGDGVPVAGGAIDVGPIDVERIADELIDVCLGGRATDDDAALLVVAIH